MSHSQKSMSWFGAFIGAVGVGATLMYPHPWLPPLAVVGISCVCFVVAAFAGYTSLREYHFHIYPRAANAPLPLAKVGYVTCEANVPVYINDLMANARLFVAGHSSWPSVNAALAAFRNLSSSTAFMTGHLFVQPVRGGEPIHVYNAAWIDHASGMINVMAAATARVVFAARTGDGSYFLPDVDTASVNLRRIERGDYDLTLDLDFQGVRTDTYTFRLSLGDAMSLTLTSGPKSRRGGDAIPTRQPARP